MKDEEVQNRIKDYFNLYELVGRRTYKRHGENAWRFLDVRLLHALLIIREGLGRPITCNTWKNGGRFSQRGLRTIAQEMVKKFFRINKLYLSAHLLGKGVDFDVKGMSSKEVRNWIIDNEDLFPFKIRLEGGVNWVHLDVISVEKSEKVTLFYV